MAKYNNGNVTLAKQKEALATFTTNRKALQSLAHEIAMMIVYHAAPKELPDCNGTGDVTNALRLMDAMPKSWAAQMQAWFKLYTPIRRNGKNVGYDARYKALATLEEKLAWWKIAEANETPFHEASNEPDVKSYSFTDLLAMIPRLAKQIEGKIEKGEVKEGDVQSAFSIVNVLNALKINPVSAPANEDDKGTNTAAGASPAAQEKAA